MSSPFSKQSDAKSIPATNKQTAHPKVDEEEHHVNADLYRTFSPSDVAMWDWRAEMKKGTNAGSTLAKAGSGLWSKLFGFKTSG